MIPESNELRFEITTKCNYNCIICPRGKLTRKIETMSFASFRHLLDKIISETGQYNTITFPGMGEPLLDETLDEKIIYGSDFPEYGLKQYLINFEKIIEKSSLKIQNAKIYANIQKIISFKA